MVLHFFHLVKGSSTYYSANVIHKCLQDSTSIKPGVPHRTTVEELDLAGGGDLVTDGQWIAEPVLWVSSWVGLGDLAVIRDPCQWVHIDAGKLQKLVTSNTQLWEKMVDYAEAYLSLLNAMESESISDLDCVRPQVALVNAGLLRRKTILTGSFLRKSLNGVLPVSMRKSFSM